MIVFILFLTACGFNFQSTSTTTTKTTTHVQLTVNLFGNDDFYSLLYGEKRIYNEEIKRQSQINTNLDISSIDYLYIEYSVYHVRGNQTMSVMITKESIENDFINDQIEVIIVDQLILINTRETIKHIIVTPIIIDKTE